MSAAKRRSFDAGHRPKFMVVVDGTSESSRAVRFGARRCARTGAALTTLGVVDPPDNFEWLGVGDVLQAEAEAEVETRLEAAAAVARAAAGVDPERILKTGETADAILALIEEDPDISFLVLAAAGGTAGPGPLVSSVAGKGFPIAVVVVPGDLTDEEIDALAG